MVTKWVNYNIKHGNICVRYTAEKLDITQMPDINYQAWDVLSVSV